MKTCKNCNFYTGIQCHGHGEYWGECKKNKNNLFCSDNTPCLQDIKTLRQLYFQQRELIEKLELNKYQAETWKERYEIKKRHLEKVQDCWMIATKYIPKEKHKIYQKEILDRLNMSSKK